MAPIDSANSANSVSGDTRQRILSAFMRLLAERGLEATTTRSLAEAAGVNEVTIFRHFGDKMTLAREAIRAEAPLAILTGYMPDFSGDTRQDAAAGLLACVRLLRQTLWEHRGILQFGTSDAWRYPDLLDEVKVVAAAGAAALARALDRARPTLRPDVDVATATLSLQSLIVMSVLWQAWGWFAFSDADRDAFFTANIRLLFLDAGSSSGPSNTGNDSPAHLDNER